MHLAPAGNHSTDPFLPQDLRAIPQQFHVAIALKTILAMDDETLRGMLTLQGEPLSPEQCRVTAQHFLDKGFTYLPTCDCDARGLCLGHVCESNSK